ncbi:MAG: DUF4398 domain-containing protein [Treponema sp.]|jgi:hypothetical protein|nr:DUF4398 domain-containing protein [Treponema sp.]
MKSIRINLVCAALALSFLLGSCAKPPTEEMNNAVEAVTRAENNADAVMYAANTLARARDALNRMKAEADSKRYDAAKTYASEAVTAAERAIADGRAGAERAREEAAAMVAGLNPAIAETEQGINAARTARLPLDFTGLEQEFAAARDSADRAEVALADGRYQDALDNCRNAQADLSDINHKLSDAAMAVSRKK